MKAHQCVYQFLETRFGKVLVAEHYSDFKVMALYFVEGNVQDVLDELHESFKDFSFAEGKTVHSNDVLEAIEFLDSGAKIPIYVKCEEEFTTKVLDHLKRIPRGQTRSYSEIAREVGNSNAARAVARVCATNNVAYLIPCHRVIASNGSVSGYRWGTDTKKKILKAEGAEINHCVM